MKKLSLTLKVAIPALFLFTGIVELYLVHFMRILNTEFSINLSGFVINLLYGIAVGLFYIFHESKKSGKWMINLPRLFLLLLPIIIISVFIILFEPEKIPLYDTIGMPYLNFTEIYYGESLSSHLCYFCSGLFLIAIFSKSSTLKPKLNWIKHFCFLILFIFLIFFISISIEKILFYAILYQDFSYYTYELIVLFINIIVGTLIWKVLNLSSDTFIRINIKKTSHLITDLVLLLIGSIPFLFICISYYTDFTVPYDNPYYSFLRFFRQSDFFQIFQILFGLTLIPIINNLSSKEK